MSRRRSHPIWNQVGPRHYRTWINGARYDVGPDMTSDFARLYTVYVVPSGGSRQKRVKLGLASAAEGQRAAIDHASQNAGRRRNAGLSDARIERLEQAARRDGFRVGRRGIADYTKPGKLDYKRARRLHDRWANGIGGFDAKMSRDYGIEGNWLEGWLAGVEERHTPPLGGDPLTTGYY